MVTSSSRKPRPSAALASGDESFVLFRVIGLSRMGKDTRSPMFSTATARKKFFPVHRPILLDVILVENRFAPFTYSVSRRRFTNRLRDFASRTSEQADETRRALGVAGQFSKELVPSEARRQFLRIQIGGDECERIMVRRSRGRAGSHISRGSGRTLAADVFFGRLAGLTLCKTSH